MCIRDSLNVREDAMQLYGFWTEEEYELFILLISVSGIGPKVGLGILSGMTPEAFKLAVINGQVQQLTKLPGIGKKSAERLVLELKYKLAKMTHISSAVSYTHRDVYKRQLCINGWRIASYGCS